MEPHIRITMDKKFVEVLKQQRRVVIRVVEPGMPARGAASIAREPAPGTHLARLVDWAREINEPFRTRRAAKAIGVNARHASVLLVSAVQDGYGIARLTHGVYRYRA